MSYDDMNTNRNDSIPVIEMDQVSKTFKTRKGLFGGSGGSIMALKGISLGIQRGEIFGLVGESGSGKTSAGRFLVKLDKPDSGRIRLEGTDINEFKGAALKDFRKKVQMIFQDPYQSLNPYLSVHDAVSEPLVVHKVGKRESRDLRVMQVLESVGLVPPEEFLYRFPHQLSGGQRQRVAIARAIVLRPEVIVADEPTSMLDASISIQIFRILARIREEFNVSFLFITHNLAAARFLCDRIAVIYRGEIVETGKADEIIENPKSPYTKALIDAQPRFVSSRSCSPRF